MPPRPATLKRRDPVTPLPPRPALSLPRVGYACPRVREPGSDVFGLHVANVFLHVADVFLRIAAGARNVFGERVGDGYRRVDAAPETRVPHVNAAPTQVTAGLSRVTCHSQPRSEPSGRGFRRMARAVLHVGRGRPEDFYMLAGGLGLDRPHVAGAALGAADHARCLGGKP